MELITSLTNAKVKMALSLQQKKYRDKYQLFILEGIRNAEMVIAKNISAYIFHRRRDCRVQQQMQNYSKKLKNLHFGVSKFNFSLGLELSLYCTFLMYRSV